jgi:hypothetical protein
MEKLVETPAFLLHLPLWLIMHPTKKAKGYITIAGQAGERVMPLFTEESLASRFRQGAPQLNDYVLGRAADAAEFTKVLAFMESQGFTHAAIDPTTKRGIRFDMEQLREITNQPTPDGLEQP